MRNEDIQKSVGDARKLLCENRCSLQTRIDKAIVDTVLGFVEAAKMKGD